MYIYYSCQSKKILRHAWNSLSPKPGHIALSVTCLATDANLTADPGVESLIQVRSHTFVEIDRKIMSTFILLPSAESFKKGCCQLQAKVYVNLVLVRTVKNDYFLMCTN